MNTLINHLRRCLFITALLAPTLLFAEVTKACFKARVQTLERKVMNMQLSSSDTISLRNLGTIYALSIDATIQQPREGSFVRIVLEDTEGKNYLVAESDHFRNDTAVVNLSEYCEETALLNGVIPLRLKCYLFNASLQLTDIHISHEMPTRGNATAAELRAVKEEQVQDIVDRINKYNVRHGKLWQAGVTSHSLRNLEKQNEIGESDAYWANLKYYVSGLYEIGERNQRATSNFVSSYADSFDWTQQRHDKSWITPIKDQGCNGPCMIYAAVGVAEAMTNLYFNDTINLNLSETFIIKCTDFYQTNQYGNLPLPRHYIPMNFIVTDSVIDEYSATHPDSYWPSNNRPYGQESIRFSDIIEVSPSGLSLDVFSDSIKKHLINDGPGAWGSQFPNNTYANFQNHYMALVGYGTTHIGDQHFIITNDSSNIVTIDASMAGKTFWKFKNSYGDSQAHYLTLVFNETAERKPAYFAKSPIIRRGYPDRRIKCEDRDGDGYFNWGIGKTPPVALPAWAFTERDADDANETIGALYENGTVETVSLDPNDWNITSSTTQSSSTFNRRDIKIKNGGKLTVTGELRCLPGVILTIESGGVLEIDGGKVVNVVFAMQSGATLNIKNNGQLILIEDGQDLFSVPQGAIFNFEQGFITKSSTEFVTIF